MAGQASSSAGVLSSIAMSLNSLDSKTSPHSLHSTYSTSSSRATICTRGCLHTDVIPTLRRDSLEGVAGWYRLISGKCASGLRAPETPESGRILDMQVALSSAENGEWDDCLRRGGRAGDGFCNRQLALVLAI